jgi:uncharacterized protein
VAADVRGAPVVTDHPDRRRFEVTVDGELAGFVAYRPVADGLDLTHTEIELRFEGQGLGSTLIRAVLDAARERQQGVLPNCPFVRRFIERHREYVDLVPAARRPEFGLAP